MACIRKRGVREYGRTMGLIVYFILIFLINCGLFAAILLPVNLINAAIDKGASKDHPVHIAGTQGTGEIVVYVWVIRKWNSGYYSYAFSAGTDGIYRRKGSDFGRMLRKLFGFIFRSPGYRAEKYLKDFLENGYTKPGLYLKEGGDEGFWTLTDKTGFEQAMENTDPGPYVHKVRKNFVIVFFVCFALCMALLIGVELYSDYVLNAYRKPVERILNSLNKEKSDPLDFPGYLAPWDIKLHKAVKKALNGTALYDRYEEMSEDYYIAFYEYLREMYGDSYYFSLFWDRVDHMNEEEIGAVQDSFASFSADAGELSEILEASDERIDKYAEEIKKKRSIELGEENIRLLKKAMRDYYEELYTGIEITDAYEVDLDIWMNIRYKGKAFDWKLKNVLLIKVNGSWWFVPSGDATGGSGGSFMYDNCYFGAFPDIGHFIPELMGQ